MEDSGYIKLHRKILDNPIYKNSKTLHLWIHLLLTANHREQRIMWNSEELIILPGQLLTGREKLASATGLTPQNTRTALKSLKSTSKITIKTYSKFSIITIINWEQYQRSNQQTNQQLTSSQPATNQQLTTNKNAKNAKNAKKSACNAQDFSNVTSYEELEEMPTSDPFIHHRKLEGKKVFDYVYQNWDDSRKGVIFKAKDAFYKCVDWSIDGEAERFKQAAINYSDREEVSKGIIMNLETFIKQWRNFANE